jgi:hypothetical protein
LSVVCVQKIVMTNEIVGFGGSLNFFFFIISSESLQVKCVCVRGFGRFVRIFRGLINGHVRKVSLFFLCTTK